MPYVSNPYESPQDFDSVEIAGLEYGGSELMGKIEIAGFKRGFGWDIKKGKGVKGATLTLNEYPPAEGTITFFMWLPEHFELVEEILDQFNYDPVKKKSQPQDIYNPILAAREINSVVAKEIGQQEVAGKGLWKISVPLIEYRPPPKSDSSSTANGSKSASNKSKPGASDDPIADAQQEKIARLLAEAKGDPYPKPKGT